MNAEPALAASTRLPRTTGFAKWRARLGRDHIAPVIAVAGTRGKTSVIRAVESMFRTEGLRIASWTDQGVEIEGQRQRGELGPWSRALTRLTAGGLDVALQEIDWTTIQAVGIAGGSYPVVAVANFCANNEACLATPDMLMARRALARLRTSVAKAGRLIVNADDFAVADEDAGHDRMLVGMSPDTPILRRHLGAGGDACWLDNGVLMQQVDGERAAIASVAALPWTRGGSISFRVQNALLATAIASECGLAAETIASGLRAHDASPGTVPGSFNLFDIGDATVVIDVPAASWFLRTTVRATFNLGPGRQIRVAGPMAEALPDDLPEIGRLLGRGGGILILHGDWHEDRVALIRAGAAANELPPLVVQASDERTAIQQGMAMIRPGDVMLIVAEDAAAVVRLVERQAHRHARSTERSPGAA